MFENFALECAPRALSLLNRSSYSKTYGCFDRNFWHFKTTDFPSASSQLGVEYLAKLWSFKSENNKYYNNDLILEYLKAALEFTISIQNKDGSFDEWYPNERGWSGPTSYLVNSIYSAYRLTENVLSNELKFKIIECLVRAGRFLIKRDEHDVLSNHIALYILSLLQIYKISGSNHFYSQYKSSIDLFFKNVSNEGWSNEYDGVDFSYNLATLSFFARLDQIEKNERILDYCNKSIEFLKYAVFPDGSFAYSMGSRFTQHLYPFALSYWSEYNETANQIYNFLYNKNSFLHLPPSTQDDHYLFYRISEYFDCKLSSSNSYSRIPCLSSHINHSFQEAGLKIFSNENIFLFINYKRGGSFYLYNKKYQINITKNHGWIIKNKGLHTNNWCSKNHHYLLRDDTIEIFGKSIKLTEINFSPLKLIIFRIANMLACSSILAYYLKRLVRSLLITKNSHSNYKFKRKISIHSDYFESEDIIENISTEDNILWGGELINRYVPQSDYFLANVKIFENINIIPQNSTVKIKYSYFFKDNRDELCVE